jgi:hypothetical protein
LSVTDEGDEMPEDARFGAPAGNATGQPADDYGFFAPVRAAASAVDAGAATTAPAPFQPGVPAQSPPPAPFGAVAPFGTPQPEPPLAGPPQSGLPVWAIVLIGVGGLMALVVVASVALPLFLSSRQHSQLAATSVALPATVIGLPQSADPGTRSQAARLAADLPTGFRKRQSAGYVGGTSTLLVAAAKAPHVLTLAEQQSLTRSFWAHEAGSVPDGSSLAAPSTPAGAGATGTLTCADELTADGTSTVCVDAQATALVVFVLASTSGSGSDPTAPAQVPPALVHVG